MRYVLLAATLLVSCNLHDGLTFQKTVCERDADCNDHGKCLVAESQPSCQCDAFYDGDNCETCVPGYTLSSDGACVADEGPDMGSDASPTPCLSIRPESIDFGTIEVSRSATLTATIENCSDTLDLQVQSLDICQFIDDATCAPTDVFQIDTTPAGVPGPLAPGATAAVVLRYTPPDAQAHTGEFGVTAEGATATLPLTAQGRDRCLQAVAQAQVDMMPPVSTLQVDVGTPIALTSENSTGTITGYEWTIAAKPPLSTATLTPNANVANPTVTVDAVGTYAFDLAVSDDLGTMSCGAPARVTVEARPTDDIYIEVSWDTPGDMDPADMRGADVDLHFLNPNGTWNNAPWDIYWQNPTADWGATGPSDDPSLDYDSSYAPGPEVLVMNAPTAGVSYGLGAHYYADHGFGTSIVTARIWVQGMLYMFADKPLAATGQFWNIATITWPAAVTAIDTVQPGFP